MTLPQQKRFSLDEAVTSIYQETGVVHTSDGLLQLAKNGDFGICFYIRDEKLRFIQLDKSNDKWRSVVCAPLFGEMSLKRIVIPIDTPNQESHFAMHTLDPRDEVIFPILEGRALKKIADNPEQETATINPYRISATDSKRLLEIAIIKLRHIGNSNSLNVDKYTKWQKEHDLPTYNPAKKSKSLIRPEIEHVDDDGNYKYFETQSTMEISRGDLCVTYKILENYIQRLRVDQIKLDEPYYSLKDASIKIKEIAQKIVKKRNLIKLAENGKIKLSIYKSGWKYVRIDELGQEMEIMPCKVLCKDTVYLIVPKKGFFKDTKRFNKQGLTQGTGTEDSSLLYGEGREPIYPFLNPEYLKRLEDNKLYICTHEMEAEHEGQSIKVSKFNYAYFPEKVEPNYREFIEWLRNNLLYISPHTDEDNDSNFFYMLEGFKGRGIEITKKDLVITREELGKHILSIMDIPVIRNITNQDNDKSNEQLGSKSQEPPQLNVFQGKSNKQDKTIEKPKRKNQLHSLIARVDSALTTNETQPSAQRVFNEIEENHYDYDDEGIIQEVERGVIQWRSKYGIEQTLSMASFPVTLSSIRLKSKNN